MNYDRIGGNTGISPRSLSNLRPPWKPGESGNISGRPKKSLMQSRLEEVANSPEFVEKWIAAAVDRSCNAQVAGFLMSREILDRVDGPVKQEIDMQVTLGLAETLSKARQRIEE